MAGDSSAWLKCSSCSENEWPHPESIRGDVGDIERSAGDIERDAGDDDRDAADIDRELSIPAHQPHTGISPGQVNPNSQAQGAGAETMDSPPGLPMPCLSCHSQALSFQNCCQTTPEGFTLPSPTFPCPNSLLKHQELFPSISWEAGHNPKHS